MSTGKSSLSGRQPRRFRPVFDRLEERCSPTSFRSIDGSGNNWSSPTWGEAGTDLLRISPVAYADGISAPSQPNNLNARFLSNHLNDQTDPSDPSQDLNTINSMSLSDYSYVWGQFIDHDMDLTPDNSGESFDIPPGYPGDPMGTESFTRSQFDPATGTSVNNPRQQVNMATSYLDLSQVYGSDTIKADALRTHQGGRLKTSPGNLLPYNNSTYFTSAQLADLNMANDAHMVADTSLFAAGDRRANENIELTAMQTLFVRNHNRIAVILHQDHPDWSDEQLYQEARKINIAQEEIITYKEFLPSILGPNALPQYQGYNPNVNASIATEFSTVAYRFGHSLLSGTVGRDQNNGLGIPDVAGSSGVDLAQSFFDPNLINPTGATDPLTGHTSSDIGAILKADADNGANEMDLLLISQVRNELFGPPGTGTDLAARDIQRARDDGIGTYNQVRVVFGLPAVTNFAQITSDPTVQAKLQAVYGTVDQIDPFEGMLAEDHVPGGDVGPTIRAVLANQFARLRDGDRFFFLNENFTPEETALVQQGDSLAKVIQLNTKITNLQSNVFYFKASIRGTVFFDHNANGRRDRGDQGLAGFVVQLEDTSGNVLATATTDTFGHYSFDTFNGIGGTGNYVVQLIVPAPWRLTTQDPLTLLISRGGIDIDGADFGVTRPAPAGGQSPPPGSFAPSQGSSVNGPLGGNSLLNAFWDAFMGGMAQMIH